MSQPRGAMLIFTLLSVTEEKGLNDQLHVSVNRRTDECVDEFAEHYHPYELTSLEELFAFTLTHSIR